jgi:sialate O-acetylesterase
MTPPLLLALISLGALPLAAAELRLASVLSDHMVLQRDKPVAVWGWADPGESVTVSFAGQSKSAIAGADGKWSLKLDALTLPPSRACFSSPAKRGARSR